MAKKKKTPEFKRCERRRWLNTAAHGGTAFINMHIEEISKECSYAYASGTIGIADCSRIVTLEFYADEDNAEHDFEHAMRKLDILMVSLGQFRGKLQEAMEAAKDE